MAFVKGLPSHLQNFHHINKKTALYKTFKILAKKRSHSQRNLESGDDSDVSSFASSDKSGGNAPSEQDDAFTGAVKMTLCKRRLQVAIILMNSPKEMKSTRCKKWLHAAITIKFLAYHFRRTSCSLKCGNRRLMADGNAVNPKSKTLNKSVLYSVQQMRKGTFLRCGTWQLF